MLYYGYLRVTQKVINRGAKGGVKAIACKSLGFKSVRDRNLERVFYKVLTKISHKSEIFEKKYYLCGINKNYTMKTATIKTIEQSDKVGLYSICFNGNDLTEYEKFVQKFMNDATLNDQILIVGNGGAKTTRTYEESEELSGYVMDLQKFDALLEQEQKNGNIKIEQNVITGIEGASFEL